MLSFTLNLYCDYILSIKRGNGIHRKSRAKPLFVLSVIECISLSLLNLNQIKWDGLCLVYLYNQLSNEYDYTNKTLMIVPYYHISSSPFYHLIWKRKERFAVSGHTPSEKYLRENLLYAKFDDELWDLLQDAENREFPECKNINNYLTNK